MLYLVYLNLAHQVIIDRILKVHQDGLNSCEIAEHFNDLGGRMSWTRMRIYPELVFEVNRKATLKADRTASAIKERSCRLEFLHQ